MFDITKKRATETATIKLKNADGSSMKDDKGEVLTATVYGPGSKPWQDGQTELSRKRTERIKEADGNITAAVDGGAEDQNEFLADMTISFNGWEYPHPDKAGKWPAAREMFIACYSDKQLGYIRDQIWGEVHSWGSFTKGSAKS
jgi:hypothetical protein